MARPEVETFVKQRLAANWTRCPVVEMNTIGEAPQDGSEYLLVQYPASNSYRMDVGLDRHGEEGGVRFVLHMQRGEGTTRPSLWAKELGDLFRNAESGSLRFGASSSPFYDDSNDEGSYWITTVVVPYVLHY